MKFELVVIFGLLVGFILCILLCRTGRNAICKGPSSSSIQRHIFYDNLSNKYYKFEPITHVCPPSINIDEFDHSDDSDAS